MEDGGLDCVEAEVSADDAVVVALLHAVVAHELELCGEFVVAADGESAVAGSAEVFGGEETEKCGCGEVARFFAPVAPGYSQPMACEASSMTGRR